MTELDINHIKKCFQGHPAVDDFSLTLDKKAFVVLAGPSGCGKTTLLKIIAGLSQQDEGTITIHDRDVTLLPPHKRGVAMVFQEAALFPHLSAYDNIIYGLKELGMTKEEIAVSVDTIADMTGIKKLLKKKASVLSGGEKQRVSIARALVRKPALFLMDEPLSALDARLRNQLRVELRRLYLQSCATFLYVTHDQGEAMSLADILIIMNDGNIMQMGKPKEIYENPANQFTAQFLGQFKINEFEGYICNHQLYCQNRKSPMTIPLSDRRIIVAVRESSIFMDDNGWEGTLLMKEDMGDVCYDHIAYGNQTIFMKEKEHHTLKIGDTLRFSFHWCDAYLFDAQTGDRLDSTQP